MRLLIAENPAIPAFWCNVELGREPCEAMNSKGKISDESYGDDEGIHDFVEVRHFGLPENYSSTKDARVVGI